MLAAGLILAIMVLPVHLLGLTRGPARRPAVAARSGARARRDEVGDDFGAPCSRTPKSGIIGGIILGLGRALGETMAVTMLIGNRAADLGVAVRARLHHGVAHRQ